MKRSIVFRIVVLIVVIMMAGTSFACGKKKDFGKQLYGTWSYVNGNGETTRLNITFEESGELKIAKEEGALSISQEEWNNLLSGIFGNINELIEKTGINLDISAVDIAETLSGLLTVEYTVKDEEEIRFTVTALKLIRINHTSQYSFKKNGDLVLNGMVFRRK